MPSVMKPAFHKLAGGAGDRIADRDTDALVPDVEAQHRTGGQAHARPLYSASRVMSTQIGRASCRERV